MSYRLIVRYFNTGVVTVQEFPDEDSIYTITNYLENAIENGAELGYEVQFRNKDNETEIHDYDGGALDGWSNIPWYE